MAKPHGKTVVNTLPIAQSGGGQGVLVGSQVQDAVSPLIFRVDGPLLADVKQFGPTWDPPLPLIFTGSSGPPNGQAVWSLDELVIGLVITRFNAPPYFNLYTSIDYTLSTKGWATFIARAHDDPMTLTIRFMTAADGVVLFTHIEDRIEIVCDPPSVRTTAQGGIDQDIFNDTNYVRFDFSGGLAWKC